MTVVKKKLMEKENNHLPWQKRLPETHKGTYGHLFIMGGSPGFTGAVCLAAQAAMRSGVGLVTVAIPQSLNPIIEVKLTEPMSKPLPETETATFAEAAAEVASEFIRSKADAVVLGPGISLHPETARCVKKLLPQISVPLVIDADALKIVASEMEILRHLQAPAILTPHPGEMSFLINAPIEQIQRQRAAVAESFARQFKVTVILKGHRTVVTDGQKTVINLTGNPGMATAGSGDVLAGITGSFLAQKMAAFEAACWASYVHGLAGDFAAREKGETSLIASDLTDHLPGVFKFLSQSSSGKGET
ncbi:MAG TPA: NAD(P)H-hydrate dehydratase [bacterium]|nr:NAD(P)H-hydrate dehydratase [bacterium]HPP12170.1 NAD(P)H-hydrate dehydratase [bacterium]